MATGDDIFRQGDEIDAFDSDVLEEFGNDVISVVDEETGKEHVFEKFDYVELPGGTYLALVPLVGEVDEEDDDELILLREEEEDGELYLSPIEDQAEFDAVAKILSERHGIPYEE